jgi:hypothetical protein
MGLLISPVAEPGPSTGYVLQRLLYENFLALWRIATILSAELFRVFLKASVCGLVVFIPLQSDWHKNELGVGQPIANRLGKDTGSSGSGIV